MEENEVIDILDKEREEIVDKKREPSFIKNFFTEEKVENIKELAELFGQSETEIKKEFGAFKAKKIYKKLNYLIDNRFRLKKDVVSLLETAVKYDFYGVSVYPSALKLAKNVLKGSDVKLRVLLNFPLGENDFKAVKYSVKLSRQSGADEIAVMLSAFSFKNYESVEITKQIKKLIKTAKNKKLVIMFDSANLSRIELENAITTCISLGIRSVLILNGNARLDREVVDDAVKISSNKVFLECKEGVCTAEQTVSMLVSGIDFLTSEHATEIVADLNDKINASTESGCKPLDKTDKE